MGVLDMSGKRRRWGRVWRMGNRDGFEGGEEETIVAEGGQGGGRVQ